MANWKKMAEAFGRAMADPSTSREGRRLIKAGKRDLTDTRLKTTDNGLRLEPANPGYDRDVAESYTRGEMGGIKDDTENIQKGYDREERGKLFDERTEQRTDESLVNAEVNRIKDDLWRDAFDKAEKDLVAESIWHLINEMRAKGVAESDILKTLKVLGK